MKKLVLIIILFSLAGCVSAQHGAINHDETTDQFVNRIINGSAEKVGT